jgi:hypothetical protein
VRDGDRAGRRRARAEAAGQRALGGHGHGHRRLARAHHGHPAVRVERARRERAPVEAGDERVGAGPADGGVPDAAGVGGEVGHAAKRSRSAGRRTNLAATRRPRAPAAAAERA